MTNVSFMFVIVFRYCNPFLQGHPVATFLCGTPCRYDTATLKHNCLCLKTYDCQDCSIDLSLLNFCQCHVLRPVSCAMRMHNSIHSLRWFCRGRWEQVTKQNIDNVFLIFVSFPTPTHTFFGYYAFHYILE